MEKLFKINDLKLNNENNLISIIVPIYKVEKYLTKCIDSIINQTYKNIEIILVDDGSPDNCGLICDEYSKKDNRIKVIHKKNGGLSDARNAGIDIALGQYIGFVDSDDYIAPDMYEYLLKKLIENDSDISICNFECVSEEGNIKENLSKIKKNEILETKEAIKRLIETGNFAWNKLYKRDLFKNIRYPVGRKVEDCGTTYKLFDLANKIIFGIEVKYYYVQREDSILHTKSFNFYKDFYELTLERYKYIKNKYPDIIENDIDMINKILTLFIQNDEEIEKYINVNKNEIKSIFRTITKDKGFKNYINKKMKIKLFIFRFNKKIFRMLSSKD